jgi:hypothetical protein
MFKIFLPTKYMREKDLIDFVGFIWVGYSPVYLFNVSCNGKIFGKHFGSVC